MWEKIFIYDELPDFETVPALKLLEFPYTDGPHRPLCQLSCVSVKGDGLYFGFKAFESAPKINGDDIYGGSAVSISLNIGGTPLIVTADGKGDITVNGNIPGSSMKPTCIPAQVGGDQQGDYFFTYIKIPLTLIENLGGHDLQEGDKIEFNAFYSIMENDKGYTPHFAALFDDGKNDSPMKKLLSENNRKYLTAIDFF